MYFCVLHVSRYCCELIVFRGTFMWCFIECLFYWVRILAIYWKYRRNCLLRNTHYLFVQKKKICANYGNWKKKLGTHFLVFKWNHISVQSSTWNVTIYNLYNLYVLTLYSHFEQYNMTLKDRRTFIVVGYW